MYLELCIIDKINHPPFVVYVLCLRSGSRYTFPFHPSESWLEKEFSEQTHVALQAYR